MLAMLPVLLWHNPRPMKTPLLNLVEPIQDIGEMSSRQRIRRWTCCTMASKENIQRIIFGMSKNHVIHGKQRTNTWMDYGQAILHHWMLKHSNYNGQATLVSRLFLHSLLWKITLQMIYPFVHSDVGFHQRVHTVSICYMSILHIVK